MTLGYGRIVNVASIAGKEGNPEMSAYSASKAGLIALTKSVGKELAQTGILVNCIVPAVFNTGMRWRRQRTSVSCLQLACRWAGWDARMSSLNSYPGSRPTVARLARAAFDLSGGRAVY